MLTIPNVELNDGSAFPELGFGTVGLRGDDGTDSILAAIDLGYRLLDTAVNYKNEREVGEAVRRSSVDRDELTVVTKIPGRDHGYDEAVASTDGSLDALGLERIDVSLIHWPNPRVDKYVDTWRAMIDLREAGKIRTIGVSNFTEAMLARLIEETGVTPAVNQVELHPYFPQAHLRGVHADLGIRTVSWSPLAKAGDLFEEPVLKEIARAHGVSPAQVVLRWHLELGSTPIPRSANPERQRENADVFGFSLAADEVEAISALERGRLWDGDPETHEEF